MSSWAARMHRRAATFSNVVTSCGHPSGPYPRRLEKVKFGVPLEEVCKNDIPGPLLVLILKLNKEAPYRKDVFRAPGNQGVMKKLIHFLQTGRLVNIDNFSVCTIASVLKKFLRKIPGGVFGRELENRFFEVIEMEDHQRQRDEIHRILVSLPKHTQHLLVLLFGTFRVISSNSEKNNTGMSSEAIGVSVAPSFFHSCVHDGRIAKMEDVMKFKIASKIVQYLIEEFATSDLFGKENYEFYARVTGRVLRVQGQWICSFQYPPITTKDPVIPNEFIALEPYLIGNASVEECQSTPALLEVTQPQVSSSSLGIITEHSLLESCTRLSISLEQNGLFQTGNTASHSSSGSHSSRTSQNHSGPKMTLDELKEVNKYAESTKSLTYLPQVHERQTERMKTRSQWFLAPSVDCSSCGGSVDMLIGDVNVKTLTNALMRRSSSGTIVGIAGLSLSAESVQKRPSLRRSNSRDKRSYLHRSTSRRAKQNGSRSNSGMCNGEVDIRKSSFTNSKNFSFSVVNNEDIKEESNSDKNYRKRKFCLCPSGPTFGKRVVANQKSDSKKSEQKISEKKQYTNSIQRRNRFDESMRSISFRSEKKLVKYETINKLDAISSILNYPLKKPDILRYKRFIETIELHKTDKEEVCKEKVTCIHDEQDEHEENNSLVMNVIITPIEVHAVNTEKYESSSNLLKAPCDTNKNKRESSKKIHSLRRSYSHNKDTPMNCGMKLCKWKAKHSLIEDIEEDDVKKTTNSIKSASSLKITNKRKHIDKISPFVNENLLVLEKEDANRENLVNNHISTSECCEEKPKEIIRKTKFIRRLSKKKIKTGNEKGAVNSEQPKSIKNQSHPGYRYSKTKITKDSYPHMSSNEGNDIDKENEDIKKVCETSNENDQKSGIAVYDTDLDCSLSVIHESPPSVKEILRNFERKLQKNDIRSKKFERTKYCSKVKNERILQCIRILEAQFK